MSATSGLLFYIVRLRLLLLPLLLRLMFSYDLSFDLVALSNTEDLFFVGNSGAQNLSGLPTSTRISTFGVEY